MGLGLEPVSYGDRAAWRRRAPGFVNPFRVSAGANGATISVYAPAGDSGDRGHSRFATAPPKPTDDRPAPSLGLPIVTLVDDDVVRDALSWLLRSRRLLSGAFASAEARFEAWLAGKDVARRWPEWPVALSCCCWTCACRA